MGKSILKKLKYPAFFLIGFGLLWLVLKDQDKGELWENIKSANPLYISMSFVMGYLAIVSRGIRWTFLIDSLGYRPRKSTAIHSVAFGYLANLGVPRSGELARCASLNQADDVPVDKLFGTVILERVIDSLILLLFLSLAFILNIDVFKEFYVQLMASRQGAEAGSAASFPWLTVVGGLFFAGVLLLVFFRKKIVRSRLGQKVVAFLKGILDGMKSIGKLKKKGWFLFHTAFIWIMYFLMAYVVCFAIPETSHLTMSDALFITVAGGLGMIVPAPGGTGSYHAAVMLGFVALGLSGVLGLDFNSYDTASELGLRFAFLVWIPQTAMIVLGGLIGLAGLAIAGKRSQDESH